MTKNRKIACLVAAGVVGVGLLLALGAPRPPVDRGFKNANLERARTEAEVVTRLGPPGDYRTRSTIYMSRFNALSTTGRQVVWLDDYASIVVYFQDPEGYKTYWYTGRALPPRVWHERMLDYLRDLLN